jgi:thioesterase domain-containing protein
VYFFYQFGQLLGPDQPLYALQDPSLGGDQEPLEHIEEYAEAYLDVMRTVQPEGPYRIGGWSFGGHVAFQIAIDLQAAGEDVDLLMIIDSEAPLAGRKLSFRQRLNFMRNRSVEYVRLFFDVIPYIRDGLYLFTRRDRLGEDHPSTTMSRLEYIQWVFSDAMYKRFARRAGIAEIVSRDSSLLRMRIPTIRRVLYVLSRHMKVIPRYIPHVYKGKLTLLRANEQITRQYFSDETLGWHQLVAGNVDIRAIAGNHVTMLKEPHVRTVAETMTACIEEVERDRVEASEVFKHQAAK